MKKDTKRFTMKEYDNNRKIKLSITSSKVETKKNTYDYKGYIKCDKYKTRNY